MVESRMTITGNLTRDPQLRIGSRSGDPFAALAVAVNNRRLDKESGQWVTTGTTYFDVLCFGACGANALRSFTKGDPVVVHGRFRLREWTSDTGPRVNATIEADSIGPDLTFGTASFTRGTSSYGLDRVEDYDPSQDPSDPSQDDELAGLADQDGVVSDKQAAVLAARGDALQETEGLEPADAA